MLPRDSEHIESREVSCLSPHFHIESRADPPNDFRRVALRGKHPAQKKQIARLHRFHICPERLGGGWGNDAYLVHTLPAAGRPWTLGGDHFPTKAATSRM